MALGRPVAGWADTAGHPTWTVEPSRAHRVKGALSDRVVLAMAQAPPLTVPPFQAFRQLSDEALLRLGQVAFPSAGASMRGCASLMRLRPRKSPGPLCPREATADQNAATRAAGTSTRSNRRGQLLCEPYSTCEDFLYIQLQGRAGDKAADLQAGTRCGARRRLPRLGLDGPRRRRRATRPDHVCACRRLSGRASARRAESTRAVAVAQVGGSE